MIRYAFTGDPMRGGDGPAVITWHGVTFPKGVPVEVSADVAAILDRHNHWTRVADGLAETPTESFAVEPAPVQPVPRPRGRPRKEP